MLASKKRIKGSKNRSRKVWRKHTNIDEIEDYLEDQRLNERLGDLKEVKFVIEKSGTKLDEDNHRLLLDGIVGNQIENDKLVLNEDGVKVNEGNSLYLLDKVGDEIKKSNKPPVKSCNDVAKNLACLKSLQNTSAVAPMKSRIVKVNESKRLPSLFSDKKFAEKFKRSKADRKSSKEEKKLQKFKLNTYDLWDKKDTDDEEEDEDIKELKLTQKMLLRKHKLKINQFHYQKPSLLPAVELPHPGQSYNPTFDDHQDILKKAEQVEIKKLREEQRLKRALDDLYPDAKDGTNEERYMREMREGLGLDSEEEKDDEDNEKEDEIETVTFSLPKLRIIKRKSKKQRRNEREQKQIQLKKKQLKEERMRQNQVNSLKKIKKEIVKRELKLLNRKKMNEKKKIEKMYKPRRLGPHKYKEPDIDVQIPSAMVGTLRQLKPEGDLFNDRYYSLQRRNIIEPRKLILKRTKAKRKLYVKRTHRIEQ